MRITELSTLKVEDYDRLRGKLPDRTGGWVPGTAVYCRGYDMMDDLVGQVDFFQSLVLNITGQLPEERFAKWLHAAHICVSWPDPRIWCNQIGAYAAMARATVNAASSFGNLAADSVMYGQGTLPIGTRLIQRFYSQHINERKSVEEIVDQEIERKGGKVNIMGFARPLASGDERVVAMRRTARNLAFQDGPHMQLALAIEELLYDRYSETMNFTGYLCAFMSDLGYSAEQVHRIFALIVVNGVTASFSEEAEKPVDSFLPLKCEDIEYTGPAKRNLPDAVKSSS